MSQGEEGLLGEQSMGMVWWVWPDRLDLWVTTAYILFQAKDVPI